MNDEPIDTSDKDDVLHLYFKVRRRPLNGAFDAQ